MKSLNIKINPWFIIRVGNRTHSGQKGGNKSKKLFFQIMFSGFLYDYEYPNQKNQTIKPLITPPFSYSFERLFGQLFNHVFEPRSRFFRMLEPKPKPKTEPKFSKEPNLELNQSSGSQFWFLQTSLILL